MRTMLTTIAILLIAAGGFAAYWLLAVVPPVVPSPAIAAVPERKAGTVPAVKFTDVTKEAGIAFTHTTGAAGKKLLPETMGPGVCVLDYDGDGKQDLLFVNGCPWPGNPAPKDAPCLTLYRNTGGKFEDVTEVAGLKVSLYGMGACSGDFDNDGFPDLFVTAVGGNRLFRNVGGKKFEGVTATAGVGGGGSWPGGLSADAFLKHAAPIPFGTSATFVDYDGDGKLDLFVCFYVTWSPAADLSIDATLTGIGRAYLQPQQFEGSQCKLYRNLGGGKFEDVTAAAGVEVKDREGTGDAARPRNVAKSLGVIACDPDDDGWPDLIVANDTVRNFFFHNVPDGKTGRKFVEDGELANVAYADGRARGAMGIDAGEFLPGEAGVVIANFANEPNTFLTVADRKRPRFANSAEAFGLAGPSRFPLKFGAMLFDYDLDGRLDLLTCNGHLEPEIAKNQVGQEYAQPAQLFWNTGTRARLFEPVTKESAGPDLFAPAVGRGCAYLDYDNDGDLDVVLCANGGPAKLLRNESPTANYFRLSPIGNGTTVNKSGIGARITIEVGGKKFVRDVISGRGYLSQSELPVTLGLGPGAKGDAVFADKVTVRWPGNGGTKTWEKVPAGTVLK